MQRLNDLLQIEIFVASKLIAATVKVFKALVSMQMQRAECGLAGIFARAKVGGKNGKDRDQVGIMQTAAQPWLQIINALVGGDHRWQACAVAMVEQLKEFFLRPRRAALGAQVIQDEQRRVAQLLKEFIIAHFALRVIGGAQMVKQIGNDHKDGWFAHCHARIGNRRRQMGFATAIGAGDHQPAFWLLGIIDTGVIGAVNIIGDGGWQMGRLLDKGLEGKPLQRSQTAAFLQRCDALSNRSC